MWQSLELLQRVNLYSEFLFTQIKIIKSSKSFPEFYRKEIVSQVSQISNDGQQYVPGRKQSKQSAKMGTQVYIQRTAEIHGQSTKQVCGDGSYRDRIKEGHQDGSMSLATKPDGLCSMSRTHMVGETNPCQLSPHTHTHGMNVVTHTLN